MKYADLVTSREPRVLVVWPKQSEMDVNAGGLTWAEAARGAWAMDPVKAEDVEVLLAVSADDRIVGAWRVVGVEHASKVPMGKSRAVNRSSFDLREDDDLHGMVGTLSPVARRRNPQTTLLLRDVPGLGGPGGEPLINRHGTGRIGEYLLTVHADGRAELEMPPDGALTVRLRAGGR